MSKTLKTILVTISIIVWTVIVAIGSGVIVYLGAEQEYKPQIEALQDEAWYWHHFNDYCHENMDDTLLGGKILDTLEEVYAEEVDEANPDKDFSLYR